MKISGRTIAIGVSKTFRKHGTIIGNIPNAQTKVCIKLMSKLLVLFSVTFHWRTTESKKHTK